KSTLGAPSFARRGAGHAGSDSPMARPTRPVKAVPGLYSFNAIPVPPCRLKVREVNQSFAICHIPYFIWHIAYGVWRACRRESQGVTAIAVPGRVYLMRLIGAAFSATSARVFAAAS